MSMDILLGLVLLLIITCEIYTFKTGVPTVTSTPAVRKKMVELLKLNAKTRETFQVLDLGSGTGKLALEIGRAFPSAQITGIELSPVPYALSLLRRLVWRHVYCVKNVTFVRGDFWAYDTSNLDAVVVYMNDNIRKRVAQKLKAELKTGALVISNECHLPQWEPIATHPVGLLKVNLVTYKKEPDAGFSNHSSLSKPFVEKRYCNS